MLYGCCVNLLPKTLDRIGLEYAERLKRLGYDYIELPLNELAQLSEQEFRDARTVLEELDLPCRACNDFMPARFYVDSWETMQAENIGYLFWGGVGTGKSYLAACIANALMEKEVAVRMTNFATILNDLSASFEGRNEYISRLCSYPLLILDDFGMERGTEYGLEQVYSVIDSRYRSGKPLIATTNLTLEELQHPQDTPHARIYDRLTSMCAPVRFTGSNFRKETAQEKLERLKQLMKQRKESL